MSALQLGVRPDRRTVIGAGWRAALVVVAAGAVALEVPVWARLPLSAAAAIGVASFFLRSAGRRGLLHAVLVVAGGGLVALALLGLVLNVLPIGIGPLGWGLAVGVLELAVLAGLVVTGAPVAASAAGCRRIPVAGIAWGAAVVAVLVGAVVYSTVSYDSTHVSPLAISAEPHGTAVTVTVAAGAAEGPFELDLVTADGLTVVARDISVAPGATYTTRIATPATRAVLQLVTADSTAPVRQLILDTAATK